MELRRDRSVSQDPRRHGQIAHRARPRAVEGHPAAPDDQRKKLVMKPAFAHPGRSPEFLSRLHDGDLSAAERVQFESHRAHCAECRGAAAQFEAALALFRSNRPRPPAPDLSARILRKLRTVSPRRSPLGVSFGIDLRWAGAFAAALLAVIIGSEVVLRREAAERRLAQAPATIPVTVESQPRSSDSGRKDSSAANAENERK